MIIMYIIINAACIKNYTIFIHMLQVSIKVFFYYMHKISVSKYGGLHVLLIYHVLYQY